MINNDWIGSTAPQPLQDTSSDVTYPWAQSCPLHTQLQGASRMQQCQPTSLQSSLLSTQAPGLTASLPLHGENETWDEMCIWYVKQPACS